MKIILIDPHTSDFVYRPLAYWLTRKRPLLKYKHLASVFDGMFYTGINSSLPAGWARRVPLIFLRILVRAEVLFWASINRVNVPKKISLDKSSLFFTFGYKNIENVILILKNCDYRGILFIHLSHYHGFPELSVKDLGFRLVLCADNDISKNAHFTSRFRYHAHRLCVLPFSVDQRFFSSPMGEAQVPVSVVVTGTVHMMPVGYLPFRVGEYSTLHPIRLALFLERSLPSYVRNELSLFNSHKGLLEKIFEQRSYYKKSIVEIYRESTHSIVASEGNGLVAIGLLESLAVGVIPIISREDYESLDLDQHNVCLLYTSPSPRDRQKSRMPSSA